MRRNLRLKAPLWILLANLFLTTPLLAQPGETESGTISPPVLDPRSNEEITLIFSEPTSVFDIYRQLGRSWGINFVFDSKLKDRKIVIEVTGVAARDGLDSVLRAANHFYTVVDPQTVMIADDTPQNRRTYEHQVIQSFQLENTRVADMMTLVRSMVGAKHVAVMADTNGIVVRDTADKVRVVEHLVRRNDRPSAEVVVDVDLLAVDREAMLELDLRPATGAAVPNGEAPPRLRAGEIDRLRAQDSTRSLARPKLDVVAGSTAELRLTDKLPLPSRLMTATATGQAPPAAYKEVGLEVKIRPWVHTAEDVSLRLEIAADTLADWVAGDDGEQLPLFGGINLESNVRLRDGETYLLTGLMITPEPKGKAKRSFPLGRFLHAEGSGTEIVLALTPHVVRGPGAQAADLEPLWIGTEAYVSTQGSTRRTASRGPGPFDPRSRDTTGD